MAKTILEQLAAEITTKKAKAKSPGKYIIEVNGRVIPARLSRKEVLKQAKATACSGATINVFRLEGTAEVDMPVSINGGN